MLRKLSSILQNDFLRLILDWKEDWWIFFRALFDLLSRSEIYRKKFSRFWTRLGIQDMSPLAKTDNSNMLLKIKLYLPFVRTVDYLGCHITNKEDWLLTLKFLCTWVVATNLNFLISTSSLDFDLTEFIVWNMKGIQHRVAKMLKLNNRFTVCCKNSVPFFRI